MPIRKGKPGGRLLWNDDARGVTAWWHWDKQLGKGIIEEVWDTDHIVERNKALLASEFEREHMESPDLKYLGSVPFPILMDWVQKGKLGPDFMTVKDQKWIKQKLNDPQYKKLRATSKRV